MTEPIDIDAMTEDELRDYALEQAAAAARAKTERDEAHGLIARMSAKSAPTADEEPSPGEALVSAYEAERATGRPADYAEAAAVHASVEAQIRRNKGITKTEERAQRAAALEKELAALRGDDA